MEQKLSSIFPSSRNTFDVQSLALTELSGIRQTAGKSRAINRNNCVAGTCELQSDILIFMSSNRNCTRDSLLSKDHPLVENHRLFMGQILAVVTA